MTVIHRKSICRPRSCDFLGLRRGSPITTSFWSVSLPLIWCRGRDPSWEPGFYRLPSFSTTIGECKREWPVTKKEYRHLVENQHWFGSDQNLVSVNYDRALSFARPGVIEMTCRPSIWCSSYYFFFHNFLQNSLQK